MFYVTTIDYKRYLQVLDFLDQFDVLLGQTSFVAGDIDDGAVELLNFDIELRNMNLQLFNGLDRQYFLLSDIVQLREELVDFLLEFRFFLVDPEIS